MQIENPEVLSAISIASERLLMIAKQLERILTTLEQALPSEARLKLYSPPSDEP